VFDHPPIPEGQPRLVGGRKDGRGGRDFIIDEKEEEEGRGGRDARKSSRKGKGRKEGRKTRRLEG
jgi:hypothetical protein